MVKSCQCPPGGAGAVGKPLVHSPWGGKQCRTWYIGPMPPEDPPQLAFSQTGPAMRNRGGRDAASGTGRVAPCCQPHQQSWVRRCPVRGRRGSRSVFACCSYTLPQPNYQQMSIDASPACSLIYGSRSREGKVRGSRGGSS